ncbi:MAG: AmmeMemoRadiSam system radical SAM enzyme [Candidatus Zixiibacteriota bacterium]
MIKKAAYFERVGEDKVICRLCPFHCRLTPDKKGICKSRYNRDGELVTDNYGELVTLAVDPIEKKPLYHFYPGTNILSTGPNSCNFHCQFCQNWSISQNKTGTQFVSPETLVETALSHNSIGVAFTYTEPLMWFEYIMDVAPLLREKNLKVVLVTNGFIDPEPLEELVPLVDAANVDLKSMNPVFYRKICKGKLEPILKNIERLAASKVHLELTNLLIPGLNDSVEEVGKLADFVAGLSDMIPLHFSAYHPDYKMEIRATSPHTLFKARERARMRLKYVFLGNIGTSDGSNSICPSCGHLLVERKGYQTVVSGVKNGLCVNCGFVTGIKQ